MKGSNAGFLRNLKTLFSSELPDFIPELDNFIAVADLLTAMGGNTGLMSPRDAVLNIIPA